MKRTLYTSEHEAFRSSFRSFLDREAAPHIDQWEAAGTPDRTFITSAAANGYLGFEFDPAVGGLGIEDFRYNAVMTEEVVASGMAGDTFTMQNDIIVPYLRDLATAEQQERWLPRFTAGDLVTALGMTEPGAGSDLAGLATRAVKVEGGWELKGQKVWTSGAHEADWGICLARTDKDVPKHKGLSYFLVDMRSTGVEVRPLKQSTGDAEFNEVFLDSVFVPDAYLLGEPGQGWRITATTLQNERTQISAGVSVGTEEALRSMISQGSYTGGESEAFASLGHVAALSSAIGALNLRETLRRVNGMNPGAGSSLAKVAHARLTREAASRVLALAGPGALFASAPGDAVTGQLTVPQVLIGGGTVEIQLNVIAERILGLPRT